MPRSRRARGRLREVAAFPAEIRKKQTMGQGRHCASPGRQKERSPAWPSSRLGRGPGAGMLMGAARGLRSTGGRGGCVLSPWAAPSTQKPPYTEAMTAKCSKGCGGHWEELGLLGG